MAENLYEGMFLLDSNRFAADPERSESEVLGILDKAGAKVVANRPWLDGKLAYPIIGRRKGMHYLTYFRMDASGVSQITGACKLNEAVLRHLIIKHPPTLFEAMVSALNGDESTLPAVQPVADAGPKTASVEDKKKKPENTPDVTDDDVKSEV